MTSPPAGCARPSSSRRPHRPSTGCSSGPGSSGSSRSIPTSRARSRPLGQRLPDPDADLTTQPAEGRLAELPPLGRLVPADAVRAIVEAAFPVAGDHRGAVTILDVDGRVVAATGDPAAIAVDRRPTARADIAPIHVDGRLVGSVVSSGDVGPNVGAVVAAALGQLVAESVARRDLATEALETYRELSLLYRIAETIGSSLDPREIGPRILSEAERVLRADAGVVRTTIEDATLEFGRGDQALQTRLAAAAGPLGAAGMAGETALVVHAVDPFCSLLAAPLRTRGRVLGSVVLGRLPGQRQFVTGDQRLLLALAQYAALALERSSYHRHDAQRLRLEQEVAIGRRIPRSLMPRRFPAIPGWEFAARYEAARDVGGDFYDVFQPRRARRHVAIVVADVTGKGIPAALFMADARALVRAAADHTNDPAEVLERVNRVIVNERRASLFITAFFALLDTRTGDLRYVSAGHEAPILVRADGSTRALPGTGVLLGAFPTVELAERSVRLDRGDRLVVYTDGVTDAIDPSRRRLGDARLRATIRAAGDASADGLVTAIMSAIAAFASGTEPADDVTLLAIGRSRPGSSVVREAG